MHSGGYGFESRPIHHILKGKPMRIGEVKISKYWYLEIICSISMCFVCAALAYYVNAIVQPVVGISDTNIAVISYFRYFGYVVSFFGFCMFIYLTYENINSGKKFYNIENVPIDEFEISKYDNIVVLSYGGHAWPIHKYNSAKVLKKESIRIKFTYDPKRVLTGVYPSLPLFNERR